MALHSSVTAPDRRPTVPLLPLLALAAFAALLIGALTALPAAAHSTLLSATPEDGAELDEAPDAIVLTFNEDITELGTDIVVSGPDGADATDGDTEIDGPEVSRPLAADLQAGEYTVTWRAVSADGHPIDGESTFTVLEGAAAEATESPSEDATEAEDPATSENATIPAADDAETDADAQPETETISSGVSAGQIALYVVIALAVIGGVTALIVRMRRQQ